MSEKNELLDLAYIIMHPVRREIVELLRTSSLYISEIARLLDISEKLASFHLATLLQYELVKGEWKALNPEKGAPKMVKYYSLTQKAENVIKSIGEWVLDE